MPAVTPRTTRALLAVVAPLMVTVLAGTLAALSVRAQAADDAAGQVYICHPAVSGQPANAKMTASSDVALSCREVSMMLKTSDGTMHTIGQATATSRTGPDLSNALTPGQVNDAWVKWCEVMFNITHTN